MYDAKRQVKDGKELRPAGQRELVVRQYELACSVRRYRIPSALV